MSGASTPGEITHSIVLCGYYWAWSMLEGERDDNGDSFLASKDIENRHGRLAPGYYAVILGKGEKGVTKEKRDQCSALLPTMTSMPEWGSGSLPKGNVVGVIKVSHSLPYDSCKESGWAMGPVCNILSKAGWIDTPIPCKGGLGAHPIKDLEILARVRKAAVSAHESGKLLKTGAETRYPPMVASGQKKRRREDRPF